MLPIALCFCTPAFAADDATISSEYEYNGEQFRYYLTLNGDGTSNGKVFKLTDDGQEIFVSEYQIDLNQNIVVVDGVVHKLENSGQGKSTVTKVPVPFAEDSAQDNINPREMYRFEVDIPGIWVNITEAGPAVSASLIITQIAEVVVDEINRMQIKTSKGTLVAKVAAIAIDILADKIGEKIEETAKEYLYPNVVLYLTVFPPADEDAIMADIYINFYGEDNYSSDWRGEVTHHFNIVEDCIFV